MSLSANKETFSFSVRILDMNVIQEATDSSPDTVGAPRNFMLVDIDGTWHDGWSRIEFMPNRKENEFLNDKKLWTENSIYFQNFIHPNRWISFYGAPYFLTKVLIDRLENECAFYRAEEKRLLEKGIDFPRTGAGAPKVYPKSERGESVPVKVAAFECEVDAPFSSSYTALPETQEALVANSARVRKLTYTTLPQLRFATRATELAFYNHSCKGQTQAPRIFPHWIRGAAWSVGYVQQGKRTEWNRLVLQQVHPWTVGFALRYRVYEKTERVAP